MCSHLVRLRLFFATLPIVFFPRFAAAEKPVAKPLDEPALTAKDRAHWAFQKPRRPAVPVAKDASWIRNPIDAFILARLEQVGLHPAPPADRATLLRRVTFDLTGLPPTPEEVEAFVQDPGPDAYERVVERLLASPQYGVHWAQHWLDVVRYAESNGYEVDGERPHAWRYRDYVIRAFNQDLPYDHFLTEQLAGDLLPPADPSASAARLIATGFHRCGPVHLVSGNTDPEVNRQEVLTEMTSGVAAAFLGLTVGCARCHDHKFDPISQADYYRLQAFFAATQPGDLELATPAEQAEHARQLAAWHAQVEPWRKQVAQLEAPYRARLTEAKKARLDSSQRAALAVAAGKRTPEQKKLAQEAETLLKITWDELLEALSPADRAQRAAWRAELHALEARKPESTAHAWAIHEEQQVPATYLLRRGDPKRKGATVLPAFLRVLSAEPGSDPSTARLTRLDLARWLTQPDHPLTARVLVNRLWQHHFGHGLVATPNDFGLRGTAPSHLALLDWLALEFSTHGWSIKQMHRLMVLSSTYRQASRVTADDRARQVDPDNHLLWRMNRRRLEGENLRDAILAVAGTLNPKLGGPMVRVPLEPEVYELIFTEGEPDGLWPITPDVHEHTRRSIFLFAKRNVRLPLLEAFDRPDSLTSCPVRPVSTFAPQALIMLNGPLLQAQSKQFALRLLREAGKDSSQALVRAYRLALGRPPRPAEVQLARTFLAGQETIIRDRLRQKQPIGVPRGLPDALDPVTAAALADFCLALLNRNEFLYVN